MEIIFPGPLAKSGWWVKFALPNENWALWRVWAMLINSCVIASPADIFLPAFRRKVQICALSPERGCVVDQPQQLRKTSLLKHA